MTSLEGINGRSIQTWLRGENDSKLSDEFQVKCLFDETSAGKPRRLKVCLFIYFFLHLFILQAIYIVLQDWRIKDAICSIKYPVTRMNGEGRI